MRSELTKIAFAKALKQSRLNANQTQEVLAKKAGLNVTHISFMESAKRHPGLNIVLDLEEALALEPGDLSRLTRKEANRLAKKK